MLVSQPICAPPKNAQCGRCFAHIEVCAVGDQDSPACDDNQRARKAFARPDTLGAFSSSVAARSKKAPPARARRRFAQDVERSAHSTRGQRGHAGVVPQIGFSLSTQTNGSTRYAMANWSMTQSHVPSPCRRAISAVTLPSGRRVEVSAKSPLIVAGR
jgi:hypothetical protein